MRLPHSKRYLVHACLANLVAAGRGLLLLKESVSEVLCQAQKTTREAVQEEEEEDGDHDDDDDDAGPSFKVHQHEPLVVQQVVCWEKAPPPRARSATATAPPTT